MQVLKGFRYRAYPTEAQWPFLRRIGGCTRMVRNLALEQRKRFSRKGRSLGYVGQAAELKSLKEAAPFLREVPHHCLQAALRDLDEAYSRFFRGISGYPKPRRKGDDSFRFPDPKQFSVEPQADGTAWLRLPKMGKSRGDHGALLIRLHRPFEGRVRSISVGFEGDHCYVSIQVAAEVEPPARPAGPPIGVDFGVAVPIMRSDGIAPYVPLPTAREKERKRRLQQTLARRKRGSRNREKARRALARHHAATARRRKHFLHRATAAMAKNHSLIRIEDLRVKNMTRSARGTAAEPGRKVAQKAGLNEAILSVGWGMARGMLDYKAAWYGSEVEARNPARTSQTCSKCWHWNPASRVTRDWFQCVKCGHGQHADHNAANVVLGPEYATPENTCPVSACGAAATAMKQELVPATAWSQAPMSEVRSLALEARCSSPSCATCAGGTGGTARSCAG